MNRADLSDMLGTILAFRSAGIAVFGDVMLDRYIAGDVERISPEAPIPVMRVKSQTQMLGGAGNVARNIAALGGRVSLVAAAGTDEAADTLLAASAQVPNLDPLIVRDATRPTTIKTRYVAQGQQLLRVDQETSAPASTACADELIQHLETAVLTAHALVCSDYGKGVLTPDTLQRAFAIAGKRGIPVIVDPKARDMSRYRGCSIITPNAGEAAAATGIACDTDAGAEQAARSIAGAIGCQHVIVTRGAQGMTVFTAGDAGAAVHLPAQVREVHDVSGAGDTVIATLALCLAAGADVVQAATLANLAAGIAVSKSGTAAVKASELISAAQHAKASPGAGKIASLEIAAALADAWREQGQSVVFTNGCFDLIHPGHIDLMQKARAEGSKLIVALNSDASVRRLKGPTRPVQDEAARATIMAALDVVDLVLIFDEDTPLAAIEAIRPDVLVKGADYTQDKVVGGGFVRAIGGRVVLVPLVAGHSTTAAIRRAQVNQET